MFKRTTTLTDLPGSFLSAQVVQPRTPPAGDDEEDADEPAISPSAQQKGKQRADLSSESASMLFQGLRFRMRGDANCEAVRSALSEHGGVCISDDDDHSESADFIIVIRRISRASTSGLYDSASNLQSLIVKVTCVCRIKRSRVGKSHTYAT